MYIFSKLFYHYIFHIQSNLVKSNCTGPVELTRVNYYKYLFDGNLQMSSIFIVLSSNLR